MKIVWLSLMIGIFISPLLIKAEGLFSTDEIRIMHEAKIRVQFPDENKAHIINLDTKPQQLLSAYLLDMSDSSLHRLPAWIKRFKSLRKLDLSNNDLDMRGMVETLKSLPKLDVLNLSNNPLFEKDSSESLAEVWQALPELGELYLQNTKGNVANYGSMKSLAELHTLDLSHNQLANKIETLSLNHLPVLEVLNLSSNQVSTLSFISLPTTTLGKLDLSHNKLSKINFAEFPKLEIWNLIGNGDIRLDNDYGDLFALPKLQKLQYDSGSDYNNLSHLPKGLKKKLQRKVDIAKAKARKLACPSGSIKIDPYIDHCNGTITDTKTGLMWKKCTEGLTGIDCKQGKLEKYKWQAAKDHAKQVVFANHSDWRLPTRMELHGLVYCSKGRRGIELEKGGRTRKINGIDQDGECLGKDYDSPTINQLAFPNTNSNLWTLSSSSVAGDTSYVWMILFHRGYDGWYDGGNNGQARLVRSRQ